MIESLKCHRCGENEAVALLYRLKVHRETGKAAILDPELICKDCRAKVITRPHPEIRIYTFGQLGKWSEQKIGYLLSKKGKEMNTLSSEFWRKRIWQIVKLTQNRIARISHA